MKALPAAMTHQPEDFQGAPNVGRPQRGVRLEQVDLRSTVVDGIDTLRCPRQNRDGTIQSWMEWMKVDKEMAAATYDSVGKAFNDDGALPEAGLRLLIEEAKKAAKITREVAASEVTELSILREAQKEFGIAAK